jgi:hypothetical protein
LQILRRGNGGEPQFPQAAVPGRRRQGFAMILCQRLETNTVPFEHGWLWIDHLPKSTPKVALLPEPVGLDSIRPLMDTFFMVDRSRLENSLDMLHL